MKCKYYEHMNCKYWDCGWCYAPEDVEHNSKNGSCNEPEYCSYNKENKTLMTEKEHLECEIKDLELEIEERNKSIQNLKNLQEQRKQKLEELQRQKPITLERIIVDCMVGYNSMIQVELLENILDRVEVEFFPKLQQEAGDTEVYYKNKGWNNCIKYLKERLRE
jgi:molybdopterin converting factor small subunit